MRPNLVTRAVAALVAGLLLGACVLLGASLLFAIAQAEHVLDASADRSRAWLRCIAQGALLIAIGVALAANTMAVLLGAWSHRDGEPWLAAAIVLLLGFAGGPAIRPPRLHAGLLVLALIALLAPSLTGATWAPCAFAAITAALAIAAGGYRLGPLARRLQDAQRRLP